MHKQIIVQNTGSMKTEQERERESRDIQIARMKLRCQGRPGDYDEMKEMEGQRGGQLINKL